MLHILWNGNRPLRLHGSVKMMKNLLFLCTLTFLLSSVAIPPIQAAHINSFAGPFNIVYKAFENCPPQISGKDHIHIFLTPTYDRTTKLQRFVGNLTFETPFDYSVGGTVAMASYDRVSGWKPNAFRLPVGQAIPAINEYIPDTINGILKAIENGPAKLPFPAGTYKVNGTVQEMGVRKFKVFQYGQYRVDLLTYDMKSPKETTACVRLIVDIVPKQK